jgi:hypothetical protein
VYAELRLDASHKPEKVANSGDDGIHVEVDVVARIATT